MEESPTKRKGTRFTGSLLAATVSSICLYARKATKGLFCLLEMEYQSTYCACQMGLWERAICYGMHLENFIMYVWLLGSQMSRNGNKDQPRQGEDNLASREAKG
jgi:hypothetical protein